MASKPSGVTGGQLALGASDAPRDYNSPVFCTRQRPLAFEFSKTRTICDAFDEAWAFLQSLGSDLTEPSKSLATQTILAKRIIEMADQGLRDIPELRDDALAFLQHSPPSAWRNGLGENHRSPDGVARRARDKAIETGWPRRVHFHAADAPHPRGMVNGG
jgi:hypothetical protein